ncbi:MAG: ferrous iron transport protein A [Clostridia bacterium]|nr:ferrous iron transport protein A [Clostridia bacterium]
MKLSELKVGKSAIISAVNGQKALRGHLLDMGLTPNTCVTVRAMAPMGDPIELSLRGYRLTLRLEDAANIEITPISTVCSGNCSSCASNSKRRGAGK